MTPVAVPNVAPTKGIKADAFGNIPTATDDAGATPLAAVARTVPCAVAIHRSSWTATLSLPRPEKSSC